MNRSEQINELATALAKVKFGPIKRDKTVQVKMQAGGTYAFSYAPLETIMSAIRTPLSDEGITLSQSVVDQDGKQYVETLMMHTSGQWRSCLVPILISSGGAQQFGSAVTYARRYGVTLITCTVADEDDDGNIAEGNTVTTKKGPLSAKINPRDGAMDSMPHAEQTRIIDMATEVLDAWKVRNVNSALSIYQGHKAKLDAVGQIALWDQFDSELRTALKRRAKEVDSARKEEMVGGQA